MSEIIDGGQKFCLSDGIMQFLLVDQTQRQVAMLVVVDGDSFGATPIFLCRDISYDMHFHDFPNSLYRSLNHLY